jgi:hypothetical protein
MFDELPEAYKKREEAKLDESSEVTDQDQSRDESDENHEYEDFEDASLEGSYDDDFDWKEEDKDAASDQEIFEVFGYETPVDHTDEYKVFENVFSRLPQANPELYQHFILNQLSEKQQQSLHNVLQKARQANV